MKQLTPDENYNTIVTFSDGSQISVYGSQIHNQDLDYWQGWNCDSGFNRILIHPDTRVFGSECENDYLGRLDDQSFTLYSEPTVCRRERCVVNPDDIMTRKTHPDYPRTDA